MIYIKRIMELTGCDEKTAQRVLSRMSCDCSEASQEEFDRSALWTYDNAYLGDY